MANWPFGETELRQERKQRERREARARERPRLLAEWEAWQATRRPDSDSRDVEDLFAPLHPDDIKDFSPSDLLDLKDSRHGLPDKKDTRVCDGSLEAALRRLAPGTVEKLCVSSSRIFSSGVCRTLRMQCGLRELFLSGCRSGRLAGSMLQAALDACVSLRSLELHWVDACPPVAANGLEELMLGRGVPSAALEAAQRFPSLQVLKFTEKARQSTVLGVVRGCPQLRQVMMYNAAEVTDEILEAIRDNCEHLSSFVGSRVGPAHLTQDGKRAFIAHFPRADIEIDDVWAEMLDEPSDF